MERSNRTTCARCAVGCGLRTALGDGGRDLRVTGDPAHPIGRGQACRRGVEETATEPATERITRPHLRRDGDLVPVSWERALDAVADRLDPLVATDPDRVGVLGSGQQTTEAAYLLGRVARGAIGTRRYDANTTLCMASAVAAYYGAFGADAPPPTYADVPDAESHVVWGANPAVAHPVLFSRIRESAAGSGGELVVVDPLRTRTAEAADVHVAPEPDGDFALAQAVLAAAIDADHVDDAFVEANTVRFDRLRASLPDVADAAEAAGVGPDAVGRLADAFSRPTLLYWGMGVNQSAGGTATARALIDCCLATGNLGPGTGPFSLTGQSNSMGTRICSSKGRWPGGRAFDDPAARRAVADAWGVPRERLPDDSGPGPVDLAADVAAGEVDALWTVATNPAVGLPNADAAREALSEVFLVAQDAFRSETVALADVVLPAATWGETAGTLVAMDRTVSRVRPARDPPGAARRDAAIIAAVGNRLRPDGPDLDPSPERTFDEFAALTAGTPADCSHVTYDRLDRAGAIRWPRGAVVPPGGSDGGSVPPDATAARYRYADGDGGFAFPTPSGRARFSAPGSYDPPEPPDETYPLVLTTVRERNAYNTGVRGWGSANDSGATDGPETPDGSGTPADGRLPLGVSPATRRAWRSVTSGDEVTVASRRGRVAGRLVEDDRVPDGVVRAPIHHPSVNRLTLDVVDPESGEPAYKACAVRVESGGITDRKPNAEP